MKKATKKMIEAVLVASMVVGLYDYSINNIPTTEVTENESIEYCATAGVVNALQKLNTAAELEVAANETSIAASPLEDATILDDGTIIPAEFEEYDMYVNCSFLNVRSTPSTDEDNVIGKLNINDMVHVIGETEEGDWLIIEYGDEDSYGYISPEYTQETLPELDTYNNTWTGKKLNKHDGTVIGPSGKETYYNLNMARCIYYMQQLGYYEKFWVRSDGVKMYGSNICCACDLKTHPKGSLIETSLGTAVVIDTGSFVSNGSGVVVDIAVTW